MVIITENGLVPTSSTDTRGDYDPATGQWTTTTTTRSTHGVVSYGVRLFGERTAFDLVLINSRDLFQDIPIGLPFVDFVYRF